MMTKQKWVEEEADPREVGCTRRKESELLDTGEVDKLLELTVSTYKQWRIHQSIHLPTYHFEQEQSIRRGKKQAAVFHRASSFSVLRYRLRQPVSPHSSIDIDIQQLHRISSSSISISKSQTDSKTHGKGLERNETFAFRLSSLYRFENHVARHYRSTTTSPSPRWRYSCRSIRAWSQKQRQS